MAETTPSVVVSMPTQLFTLARAFKAAANGRIYIGKIDTDPTIPENQIQAYLENEDGTSVPVAQPMMIGQAGLPVYNGQIAKFTTTTTHSMAIYDAYGVQQFYFHNVLKYNPGEFAGPGGAGKIGIGYPEGTTFNYSTVQAELGYSLDMFGGDPTGVNNSYDAMTRALAFLATSDAKFKVLKLHGKYKISGSTGFTLPSGVSIVGNHEGMTQGPQTEQVWPQDYAYDSTLIIDLPPGVDCFTATANNVFAGFSVIYNQPQSVATAADFIQYGYFIRSNSRSMALVNMRYAGAYNWAYLQGECPFVENVYGYAINIDYRVHRSADVGRFSNVHINPNVTRPAWSFINAAAMIPTSCAFHFTEHDGMFINDTHVFGKNKVVINNQNGTARLCTVNGSNWLVDKCGTLLKSDINSGLTWGVNNGTFISRYCSEGGGVMLTNPLATQVSGYQFDGWKFQIDADTSPVTAVGPLPARWFNFGTASGCRVWLNNFIVLAMPNMEFNNDAQSNLIEGSATVGTRTIIFDNKPKNRLSNVWLASVDPATLIPYGYAAAGSNITINRNVVTSTNPASSNGVGISQRVFTSFTGACSIWVYASSVGDSVGVSATAYLADFGSPIVFPSTGPAKWERFGNEYLARISIPASTNRVIWDVVAAAPSATGGLLVLSDFNMTADNPLTYWHGAPEVQLQAQQINQNSGTMTVTPGVATEVPRYLWASDVGAIIVHVRTANSALIVALTKRMVAFDGTLNIISQQAGSETVTVAWPSGAGKRPTIMCSANSTAMVTISGV